MLAFGSSQHRRNRRTPRSTSIPDWPSAHDLHRCAGPDRGVIEGAESPSPVAEQFEMLVVMPVDGAAVSDTDEHGLG